MASQALLCVCTAIAFAVGTVESVSPEETCKQRGGVIFYSGSGNCRCEQKSFCSSKVNREYTDSNKCQTFAKAPFFNLEACPTCVCRPAPAPLKSFCAEYRTACKDAPHVYAFVRDPDEDASMQACINQYAHVTPATQDYRPGIGPRDGDTMACRRYYLARAATTPADAATNCLNVVASPGACQYCDAAPVQPKAGGVCVAITTTITTVTTTTTTATTTPEAAPANYEEIIAENATETGSVCLTSDGEPPSTMRNYYSWSSSWTLQTCADKCDEFPKDVGSTTYGECYGFSLYNKFICTVYFEQVPLAKANTCTDLREAVFRFHHQNNHHVNSY